MKDFVEENKPKIIVLGILLFLCIILYFFFSRKEPAVTRNPNLMVSCSKTSDSNNTLIASDIELYDYPSYRKLVQRSTLKLPENVDDSSMPKYIEVLENYLRMKVDKLFEDYAKDVSFSVESIDDRKFSVSLEYIITDQNKVVMFSLFEEDYSAMTSGEFISLFSEDGFVCEE